MDRFTSEDLKVLMNTEDGICVSIYMPTEKVGDEKKQEPIRLKNLLRKAEEMHTMSGLRPVELRRLLLPAHDLLDNTLFWQYQDEGLALFLSSSGMTSYRLPIRFDEMVVMAEHFQIKPLLPLFTANGYFFILLLGLGRIRLLQCSRYSLGEIDLKGIPADFDQFLRLHETGPEYSRRTQVSPASFMGNRPEVFHGFSSEANDRKPEILRYFQDINDRLRVVLHDERAPLVLAGEDYLLPIYRDANTYSHVTEVGIMKDPEDLSHKELLGLAWEIVQPRFLKAQQEAETKYRQLSSKRSRQASDDLEDIVLAAHDGRVDTLFVAVDVHKWGWFDPDTSRIEVLDEPATGTEDLLDIAAAQTYLNRGNVYAMDPSHLPGESCASAIFRY